MPAGGRGRLVAELLLDTCRAESELLAHRDFGVDELRRELGVTGRPFETVFDPAEGASGGALDAGTVLRVGSRVRRQAGAALRYAPTRSTPTARTGSPATTSPRSH